MHEAPKVVPSVTLSADFLDSKGSLELGRSHQFTTGPDSFNYTKLDFGEGAGPQTLPNPASKTYLTTGDFTVTTIVFGDANYTIEVSLN